MHACIHTQAYACMHLACYSLLPSCLCQIGDKTGQAAAQMNLSDIRKVLGLPPAPFDQDSAEDNKARTRRKSMENMDLLKVSFVAAAVAAATAATAACMNFHFNCLFLYSMLFSFSIHPFCIIMYVCLSLNELLQFTLFLNVSCYEYLHLFSVYTNATLPCIYT